MFDLIFPVDHLIFRWINHYGASSFLDPIFKYGTDLHKQPSFLIIILSLLIYWVYKEKAKALKRIAVLILLAGVSDVICYHVIKQSVYRPRPNQDQRVHAHLKVNYGPKSSSFPSNHSTTSFALMAFLAFSYRKYRKAFWGVALFVAYSRVYVGVHYPSDVIVGALLGLSIGWLAYKGSYGFLYSTK